jgi:hypothetical protein
MKSFHFALIVGGLSLNAALADNAVSPSVPPVGPAPMSSVSITGDGSLQVFSARAKHDPGYLWDIFVGGVNDDAQFDPAHSDYTIYGTDGKVVRKVRNAREPNDAKPTVVALAPGSYLVKADDRDYGSVTVPIVIQPGELTTVNLERGKNPVINAANKGDLVLLHGYRVVGWRAHPASAQDQTRSLAHQQ